MHFENAVHRAAEHVKLYSLVALCSPCLLLWCIAKGWSPRSGRRPRLPYPNPLPTDRIDIGRDQPLLEQPPTCHLLRLPPELRCLIFEMAVGNRLVHLELVENKRLRQLMIRTACYAPLGPQTPNPLLVPAEMIPVGLLLACRQVYLEVLPILHQRNTFYFYLEDFRPAIQCGLGQYCLPDIRRVYLFHSYPDGPWARPWEPAFLTLQKMPRLDTLALEFEILEWTDVHPRTFSIDNAWCRNLLETRGLRSLDIFFRGGNPVDNPDHRETVERTLRELMVGPEADERYKALLLACLKPKE
ncbi:hypothetical protein C8R43DRAFT_1010142 [Mycena crocata]|nr:hypothetical protein C8R43DRAFT_1010142 [Mycena crocata]